MFCHKCGNEISDDSAFCPKCGTKVESDAKKDSSVQVDNQIVQQHADKKDEIIAPNSENSKGKKKQSLLDKIKKSKGAKIGIIAAAVAIAVVIAVIIGINVANAGKASAYDEGVQYLQSGSLPDAEDSFQKAVGYKDGEIYYMAVKAARQLYNDLNPGDALTTLRELVNKDNNRETITKYSDRESSKIACFVAGEVYYATSNLTDADKYYSYVPITYNFLGHSCYQRRAVISLTGSWSGTTHVWAKYNNSTFEGDRPVSETFYQDGKNDYAGKPELKVTHSNGDWVSWKATDGGSDSWAVDTSYDGTDGTYHYYYNGDKSKTFLITTDGVLEQSSQKDDSGYRTEEHKVS